MEFNSFERPSSITYSPDPMATVAVEESLPADVITNVHFDTTRSEVFRMALDSPSNREETVPPLPEPRVTGIAPPVPVPRLNSLPPRPAPRTLLALSEGHCPLEPLTEDFDCGVSTLLSEVASLLTSSMQLTSDIVPTLDISDIQTPCQENLDLANSYISDGNRHSVCEPDDQRIEKSPYIVPTTDDFKIVIGGSQRGGTC